MKKTSKNKTRVAAGRRKVAYIEEDSTWDGLNEIAKTTRQTASFILRYLTRQFVSQYKDIPNLRFKFDL
jgi:spore cortex formation protein SpoVR/YcgB (stage V sporulation)